MAVIQASNWLALSDIEPLFLRSFGLTQKNQKVKTQQSSFRTRPDAGPLLCPPSAPTKLFLRIRGNTSRLRLKKPPVSKATGSRANSRNDCDLVSALFGTRRAPAARWKDRVNGIANPRQSRTFHPKNGTSGTYWDRIWLR